jgi:hypothetical protein
MMTHEEIHQRLSTLCDEVMQVAAVAGAELPRDEEGFIRKDDDSDLAIAVHGLDHVSSVLARVCFKMMRP